jgi:uncharacterized protein (TIGR03083 family)
VAVVAEDNEIQLDRLARSFAAVSALIDAIQPGEWSAPTQCMDWTVHRLVEHLVGKNLVFAAVLAELPLPQRGDGVPSGQLARAYRRGVACLRPRGWASSTSRWRLFRPGASPTAPRRSSGSSRSSAATCRRP